jgi:hypothetical protein
MATSTEFTLIAAVRAAEGVRQVAKQAAFVTYGYVQANLAAYLTALEAADNAFVTTVQAAALAAGAVGYTIPNSGTSPTPNPGNVIIGDNGSFSLIGGQTATLGAIG